MRPLYELKDESIFYRIIWHLGKIFCYILYAILLVQLLLFAATLVGGIGGYILHKLGYENIPEFFQMAKGVLY